MTHTLPRPLRTPALRAFGFGAAAVILFGLAGVAAPVGHAERPTGQEAACGAKYAAWDDMNRRIQEHNAKPHSFELPRERAGYDAYNAEAAALDAEANGVQTRLDSCIVAATNLSGSRDGSGINAAMPQNLPQLIKRAHTQAGSRQEEIDELVGVLDDAAQEYDDAWSDQQLQGQPQPQAGDADPAFADGTIGTDAQGQPQVTPDYVIPLSDVLAMPKFLDLNPDNMWLVTMAPINHQWISDQARLAKNSPSVAEFKGLQDKWMAEQKDLADTVRQQLQDAIDLLASTQEEQK